MILQHNYPLKPHNTFALDVFAEQFVSISSEEELREVFRSEQGARPVFVLGGGSNVLFTQNVQGLVCKIALTGIRIVRETAETLDVECAAGEGWDDVVRTAVQQNWGGIENLSLIPGSIGAAPVQNIGAYGVELKDVLVSVQGMMRDTGEMRTLTQEECKFGYRDSIFKRDLRNKFVITSVMMRLRKNPTANNLHTSYGAIREELTKLFPETPHESYTVHHVSEAVRSIRRSKLPDPAVLGNAGSFFKNPEVSRNVYERLHAEHPAMPVFVLDSGKVKIPAAWLIEQTGWKGRKDGDAGMHAQQALVLVNYGNATGQDLVRLSERVRADVFAKFALQLETEVNIV